MLQNNTSMREIGADLARSRETLETFTGDAADAKLLSIFFVSWLVLVFILIFFDFFILCRHFLWEGPGHDFFLQMDKRKEVTLITSFIASILRGKLACDFCTRYTFYIKTITIFTPKYLIRIHSKLALNMTVKHFWKNIRSKIWQLHPRLALVVVWWVSLASIFVPFFRFSCKEDLGHVITVNAV